MVASDQQLSNISSAIAATICIMYARYIPPTKPKASTSTASAFTASAYARRNPFSGGADTESAPLPQAQKIVFEDNDFPTPEPKKRKVVEDATPVRSEEPADGKKRRRKSKARTAGQSWLETTEADTTSANVAQPSEDQPMEDAPPVQEVQPIEDVADDNGSRASSADIEQAEPQEESEKEQKPAKPPKKPKKKKPTKEIESDDDDRVQERHKAILEKRDKAVKAQERNPTRDQEESDEDLEPQELHGLEPLPQPRLRAAEEPKLAYETLPSWLASPIAVSSDTTASFTDLGIAPEVVQVLEANGIREAFAVQTAALPLLLPSTDRQSDLVISAATGSGKTLSYVLPMVRDISQGIATALRGIIVLPTRDLVDQVRKTCETCSAAYGSGGRKHVIIGEALGRNEFKKEQAKLMEQRQRYDPAGYARNVRARSSVTNLAGLDDHEILYSLDSTPQPLPDHVIEYNSTVDILICTPGRLVEHIKNTPGFTLDFVRWLIVDEADKLLAQDFQDWLAIIMEKLDIARPGARDFPDSNKVGVRKVILSATMTRDLSMLNDLKLSRPQLILLDAELKLPDLLSESAIKIREPSQKPLYLVDLLDKIDKEGVLAQPSMDVDMDTSAHASDSESDSDSDSSPGSGSSSGSDSESEAASSASEVDTKTTKASQPTGKFNSTVLIFTRSTEAALRLTRLLALLSPHLAPLIGTLASATRSAQRERTLRAFSQGKIRILIASDLVSRGIDLPNLDHVINYDIPINATSYVHRVGRTARAGRPGHAWTLLSHAEAHTFWTEFGGEAKKEGNKITRATKVERVNIGGDEFAVEKLNAYETALAQLRQEAGEGRK